MYYTGNWVDSVPQNFQWSNATLVTKGMAPYGAVALAEIDEVIMRSPVASGPAPTVVLFDGLDNCKEMSVLFAGAELAFRGFHTLAIDGPGQGEALRLRHIHSRYDYEVAGTAAYDYVASRKDVDAQRVAVMAYSLGGYYAPRIAAFEKRYAACVAWGAIFDYHDTWVKRRIVMQSAPPTSMAASHFQLPWVLGVADMDAAMEKIKRYTLAGVAQRIECPTLICHGDQDRLSNETVARQLYDAVGAKDKTLKIFSADDGGVEHCQVDNRQVGTDYIAD